MAKKVILSFSVFILVLLSLTFVSAQPPFQQSTGTDVGLTLRFPPVETIKLNRDVVSHMHVYNSSNDLILTNTSVTCFIHLYNQTGNHILEKQMGFEDNGVDFDLKIAGGNFSTIGRYSFIIWCNSTTQGGFVSGGFDVTSTGSELLTSQSLVYVLLFGVLAFIFVMVMWFIEKLPSSNTKDEEGKILSISYLKYLRATFWFVEWIIFVGIIFLASNLAFAYLAEELFAKILFVFYQICMLLTPLVVVLWIIWIFRQMFHDKEFQRLLNRGFFPQGKL